MKHYTVLVTAQSGHQQVVSHKKLLRWSRTTSTAS